MYTHHSRTATTIVELLETSEIANIHRAFVPIGVKKQDRDSFRFLFGIIGDMEHLNLFGGTVHVVTPFILGASLDYHYEEQAYYSHLHTTVQVLWGNSYVHENLMKTSKQAIT